MNTTYQNDEDEDILIEQQNKGFGILPFVFLLLIVLIAVILYEIRKIYLKKYKTYIWLRNFHASIPRRR